MQLVIAIISAGLAVQALVLTGQAQTVQQEQTPTPSQEQQYQDEALKQQINLVTNNDQRGLWPMVNVDKKENKSIVDVHVPVVFDMNHERDTGAGKSKLDLSVLHGLVTVSRDKTRQVDGSVTGPLTVTVFGIPVYSGTGRRGSILDRVNNAIESSRSNAESRVQSVRTEAAGTSEAITEQVRREVHKSNDQVVKKFNSLLDRLNDMIRTRLGGGTSQETLKSGPKSNMGQQIAQQVPADINSIPTNVNAPSSSSQDLMQTTG